MSGPITDSRVAIDRAILEKLVGSERDFREEVLVSLTELKVCMKNMRESFDSHVKDDERKFGEVNLNIGENSGKLQWLIGGAVGMGVLITIGIAIARFFV